MNVIGHQAIGGHFNFEFGGIFAQPLQVNLAVFIAKKHISAAFATLRDVVGQMGEN